MLPRILIAENDDATRQLLEEVLNSRGYEITSLSSGEAFQTALESEYYDLVIIDLALVKESGIDLIHQARLREPQAQLIILAAKRSFGSALKSIRYQAADYLVKPLNKQRVSRSVERALEKHALLGYVASQSPTVTRHNGITVNFNQHSILWHNHQIQLTPSETRLLRTLMENPGKVVTYEQLAQAVQGYAIQPAEASLVLRPLVSRLRQKLDQVPGGAHWIINIRGEGYLYERRQISS